MPGAAEIGEVGSIGLVAPLKALRASIALHGDERLTCQGE